ncbi:hypothetical protein [Bizionia arctica]|uniref:Glycine zipper domain-containing protein n=1 Tax=Bizionia arctica TaxID=1495645 RepID=A0A917GDP2_9FLAO|nr:hypothetical protein [Bizionia arctica]GGG40519.1 hypothetical protein GCM10010976_10190 [Bizionia arctica]
MLNKQILSTFLVVFMSMSYQVSNAQDNNPGIAKSLGLYVFPTKNQSADQQSTDQMDCYTWAKQQTGVDPMNPPKATAAQVEKGPDGSLLIGGAGGAAAGAAVGAIAGDAGEGAAIGAVLGGLRRKRASMAAKEQQQAANNQAATASDQQQMGDYKKAFTACMQGKGYTVQ